jgi:hypothetical protein
MFGEVVFSGTNYSVYLTRIQGIQNGTKAVYLDSYSTETPSYEYLDVSSSRFGSWVKNKTSIIAQSL